MKETKRERERDKYEARYFEIKIEKLHTLIKGHDLRKNERSRVRERIRATEREKSSREGERDIDIEREEGKRKIGGIRDF